MRDPIRELIENVPVAEWTQSDLMKVLRSCFGREVTRVAKITYQDWNSLKTVIVRSKYGDVVIKSAEGYAGFLEEKDEEWCKGLKEKRVYVEELGDFSRQQLRDVCLILQGDEVPADVEKWIGTFYILQKKKRVEWELVEGLLRKGFAGCAVLCVESEEGEMLELYRNALLEDGHDVVRIDNVDQAKEGDWLGKRVVIGEEVLDVEEKKKWDAYRELVVEDTWMTLAGL